MEITLARTHSEGNCKRSNGVFLVWSNNLHNA
jgi:hypothetical protein